MEPVSMEDLMQEIEAYVDARVTFITTAFSSALSTEDKERVREASKAHRQRLSGLLSRWRGWSL